MQACNHRCLMHVADTAANGVGEADRKRQETEMVLTRRTPTDYDAERCKIVPLVSAGGQLDSYQMKLLS